MITQRTAVLLMLFSPLGPALVGDLVGQASIIDGDTIEIHGTRIRLWGIDEPESTQLCRGEDSLQYRCGAKAANDLDAFIARRPVNCIPMNLDQYLAARLIASNFGEISSVLFNFFGPNLETPAHHDSPFPVVTMHYATEVIYLLEFIDHGPC
jgi:hypothetical protein